MKFNYFAWIMLLSSCGIFQSHHMSKSVYDLNFYTQYHQFYICDRDSPKEIDREDFWTDEAVRSRIAIGSGILGISVECYGPLKGQVTIIQKRDTVSDFSGFDHVVEASLSLNSGHLQILDSPNLNQEKTLVVKPGEYRVRVYSSNLKTVLGDEGNDFYSVVIWPELAHSPVVLKQYDLP